METEETCDTTLFFFLFLRSIKKYPSCTLIRGSADLLSSYIVANRCILIKEKKKYVFVPKEILRVVIYRKRNININSNDNDNLMVHTFLISNITHYYDYCRVGTVLEDALPVNVTYVK